MAEIVNTPEEGNASEVTTPESNVPEHLQGKAPHELVQMYQSLERKLGQQSEELGSLRKLADQSLMSPPASSREDTSEDVDFYTDPERAVERIIERKLRPYEELTSKQRQEAVVSKLTQEFPDWQETVKAEPFQQWVSKSKVRLELFQRADGADYDSAAELLSTWNEVQQAKSETGARERKAVEKDRKLRAATTEKGSAGIDPRKILSRADLRELKLNNPSRYNELLPDIRRAYQEGRVR